MSKILCSTGAITGQANRYNFLLLESLSKQLKCDGFELMIDKPWYKEIDTLKSFLIKMNFYIPIVHCEKDIGEMISIGGEAQLTEALKMFTMDCDIAKSIKAKKVVLHLWGGTASDSNFQNNINAYLILNDIAKNYGLDLLVENVVCNVESPIKHLFDLRKIYPNIHFVFDTKMAEFHGELGLLYEPEYEWLWKEEHILHYHVNDYTGGYKNWRKLRTLPIGKGGIDFKRFFDFIKRIGYKGDFTVEATAFDKNGMVDVDMLNEQFSYIRENITR